jgi:outer membrane protein OmpA-like peptidoglycan-associated protein
MIKPLILTISCSLAANCAWSAERAGGAPHEAIGFGTGAAVGALGGPLGVLVGAAFGGWLGNQYHEEHAERLEYERRWQDVRAEVDSLNALLQGSQQDVDQLRAQLRQQDATHRRELQQALDVMVFFKTAESELAADTAQRLARLGRLIGPMDGVFVRLEGYADVRGDEAYNEELSARRAAAVRDVLIRAGVPADRITLTAAGERAASGQEGDVDALALDRRVRLTLTTQPEDRRAAAE